MHSEEMGHCSHCGSENLYNAANCTGCGWRLPWADAIEAARASAAQPMPRSTSRPLAQPVAQPLAQSVAQPLASVSAAPLANPAATNSITPARPDNVWVVFCGQCGSAGSSAAHFCSRCGQALSTTGSGEALAHQGATPAPLTAPSALARPATPVAPAIAHANSPFAYTQAHPGGVNVTVNTVGMQGDGGIAHRREPGGFWPLVWWMVTAPFRFAAYCVAGGLIWAGFAGAPPLIFVGALLALLLARPIIFGRG